MPTDGQQHELHQLHGGALFGHDECRLLHAVRGGILSGVGRRHLVLALREYPVVGGRRHRLLGLLQQHLPVGSVSERRLLADGRPGVRDLQPARALRHELR